ncbi:hypothetical protein RB195_019616 [Necator americanus]|uniref:Uncharacterized protein n=1 Tax=Necator americanus TaxID=51031 RepID=A0ABR1CF06_NECAM
MLNFSSLRLRDVAMLLVNEYEIVHTEFLLVVQKTWDSHVGSSLPNDAISYAIERGQLCRRSTSAAQQTQLKQAPEAVILGQGQV